MEDAVIEHVSEWDVYQSKVNSGPCIVKYLANWCTPCKKIAPTYLTLANQHHDKITFIEVDIDQAEEISMFENIRSIPMFLFYDKGHQYKELTALGGNSALLEANVAKFVDLIGTHVEEPVTVNIITPATTTSSLSNLADDDQSDEDASISELEEGPEDLQNTTVDEEHEQVECEETEPKLE